MPTTTSTGSTTTAHEPLWTGRFLLLLTSAVLMYVSTFMLTPTLPLYVEDIGAGTIAAGGVIVAAYTLGSLLPRMLWGRLSDTWSRRGVYLIGVLIVGLVSPLIAVAVVLPLIVGLRFLQGVGFSASSTSASAMAVDLLPASRRTEGVGYYALANTLGMALGPDLGLTLLQSVGSVALFAVSLGTALAAAALGLLLRSRRPVRADAAASAAPVAAAPPMPASRLGGFLEPSVLPVCVVFFFVIVPYGAVMAYVAAYGLDRGVSRIGLFFTVFAAALFVVRLGIGRFTDRLGPTAIFFPGSALMVIGLGMLFWADGLAVFLASAGVFGLGYGVVLPVLQAMAFTFAPAERRGRAGATLFATADIAYGAGALLVGALVILLGYPLAFAALTVPALIAMVLYGVLLLARVRRSRATT